MSKKGLGKFVLGAGIGAGLALLFAPKKGSDLRRDIKRKFDEFMKDVDKIEIEDIKESFTKKVDEIKKIGLEVPQVTELGHLLRTSGLNINEGILSIDELVNEIKKAK